MLARLSQVPATISAVGLACSWPSFLARPKREVPRFPRTCQAILISPRRPHSSSDWPTLSHGSKEGLTDSPRLWPGVHAVRALLGESSRALGSTIPEYAARHRREAFDRLKYATEEPLTLDPLPVPRFLGRPRRPGTAIPCIFKHLRRSAGMVPASSGRNHKGSEAPCPIEPTKKVPPNTFGLLTGSGGAG